MSTEEPELDLGLDDQKTDNKVVEEKEPDDGIAELKRQLEAEKASRIRAEETARSASQEVARAKSDVEDTNLHLLKTAIEKVKSDSEDLKLSYATALRDGEYLKAAEIQMQMTTAVQNLVQLENGLDAMKNKPKTVSVEEQTERFINSLSPRSADWVRKHSEYVKNPTLNQKMLLAHAVAVDDGHVIDSDSYFDAIEERLGLKKVAKGGEDEDASSEASVVVSRRDSAPAAAPVSRSGGSERNRNIVRLSPEEREIAESLNMKPEDYARNKADLLKEGRMHRNG